ncbi:MAG: hypothetical protein WCK34_14865, partial [Bacteroidota bacterium]
MKKLIILFIALLPATMLRANGVSVSNASLTGKNTTSHTILVNFNLTWDNSWHTANGPANWDAIWLFVKFRKNGGDWQHAWLSNTGFSSPPGSAMDIGLLSPASAYNSATNPGLGAFIYPNATELAGTNTFNSVHLQWNYGDNGVADGDQADIKIFAVEMVYVRGGAFTVGNTGGAYGSLSHGRQPNGTVSPFGISSENAIPISNTNFVFLWAQFNSFISPSGMLPAA